MPMVIVALFIIVIISVTFFFYKMLGTNDPTDEAAENDNGVQYEAPSENTPPADEGDKEEPVEEEAEEEPAAPETEMTVEGTDGQTTTYAWTGPAEREMIIELSGPSWIAATDENGGNLMPAATMQAGQSETIDLSGASEVRLRLGAAPNVKLTLNDEPIEYEQDLTTQNIVIKFTDSE